VDFEGLLATMASDYLSSFARQVWMVDACQTFTAPALLPGDTLPAGKQRRGLEQDVLFAASPGQSAVNLTADSAGLFTRELLAELRDSAGAGWPPDPAATVARLSRRFEALRAMSTAVQTPVHLWHRSRFGSEGQVIELRPDTEPARAGSPASISLIAPVVDALMEIDEFADPNGRQLILTMIRRNIATAVPRSNRDRMDAFAIVKTCTRFPGGLSELVSAVGFVLGNKSALTRLEATAAALTGREEHPVKPYSGYQ
jgi:hypothetical protein